MIELCKIKPFIFCVSLKNYLYYIQPICKGDWPILSHSDAWGKEKVEVVESV